MLTNDTLPVLGACMPVAALRDHLDWLVADQRDLEIQDFTDAALLNDGWRDRAAEAREMLRQHTGRRGIHGPFWGFSIGSKDVDIQALVARRMDQALDAAAEMEADQIVIHSPYTTWDHNNIDMLPDARADRIACARACLGAALKRAESLGVTFVLENIEDRDPMERARLADALESPAVALSIDTGHAHYAHVSTGAAPVDYFVTAAGSRLAHVHIQDADGYADRHWAPGMGTINWKAVFAALGRIDARPRLNLELRDKTQIKSGAAALAEMGLAR